MNGDYLRNEALVAGLLAVGEIRNVKVVVCPPFPYISQVASLMTQSLIDVGAQNICLYKDGAYTGEVSATMLQDLGCGWVIVGHSERRTLFGEGDDVIAGKVAVALEAGLQPILCVGETLLERESGLAFDVVGRQLDAVANHIGNARIAELVVAYEPVWAIGTGKTATPEQVQTMHAYVRAHLGRGGGKADSVRILYGGSVTAANAPVLFAQDDVDGALVGGASLQADGFLAICMAAV